MARARLCRAGAREEPVSVNGELVSKIGKGLMCLIGVRDDDEKACSELIAKKILVYL